MKNTTSLTSKSFAFVLFFLTVMSEAAAFESVNELFPLMEIGMTSMSQGWFARLAYLERASARRRLHRFFLSDLFVIVNGWLSYSAGIQYDVSH
jgi:hypothetical protein